MAKNDVCNHVREIPAGTMMASVAALIDKSPAAEEM
jgi:hypothetical protein